MASVHVGEDTISNGEQSGFCRMEGTETMLRGREKMVVGHVGRQLALHYTFGNFGYDRNDRNRTVVGDNRWITRLENRMDQRVLPGIGKIT